MPRTPTFLTAAPVRAQPSTASPPNKPVVKRFDKGQLIAVVGADHILAGDLGHFVEPVIEENRDKISSPEMEEKVRQQITRQALKSYVEIKALYQEFFRDMVGSAPPEKIDEMKKTVVSRAGQIFFEKQVPNMLEQYEAEDWRELEVKLREKSMSLASMRSQFVEQVLAQELERKYVPDEFEITREELLAHYQEHREQWNEPARARWQQLTIRFDRHDENRQVVETLIKQLGNQVYLGGMSFEAAARQSSEGFSAEQGGVYDWTTQGSLRSKPIDAALFSIPLRRLSKVITDDVGMHIVMVLERTDEHTKTFTEAQAEIRETLSKSRRAEEVKKFRESVLNRTPIWTLWPEDLKPRIKHARPLEEAVGGDAQPPSS